MAREIFGITINEGYTDIGTFEVEITEVEFRKQKSGSYELIGEQIGTSNDLFFWLKCANSGGIQGGFKGVFTIKTENSEVAEVTRFSNQDGFTLLPVPQLGIVKRATPEGIAKLIRMRVDGPSPLDSRPGECYLNLIDGSEAPLYSLIWDLIVNNGYLCVFDGNSAYYKVSPPIAVSNQIDAIQINNIGRVLGYNTTSHSWAELGYLNFSSIASPQNLTVHSDGFYKTNGTTGTVTSRRLGVTGPFSEYRASIRNSEPHYVNVDVSVFPNEGGTSIGSGHFTNLLPGSRKFNTVDVTCATGVSDNSPAVSSVGTFSSTLVNFLNTNGMSQLDKIRKRGPIAYLTGLPSGIPTDDVKKLQAHVDFYQLNPNHPQNQLIIDAGYLDLFTIGRTPKEVFINDVSGGSLTILEAGRFHEMAAQNEHLATNKVAALLSDMHQSTPRWPVITGSTFHSQVFESSEKLCGCDDCQSALSPFAYLMDLIKYGSEHVGFSGSPNPFTRGGSFSSLITTLSGLFLQPFGTLDVDCDTLHKEFCRVRIVTEILQKYFINRHSIISGANPNLITNLVAERKQFMLLTYQTLLAQAGTSFNELRDVVTTQPQGDKIIAAQKLADKLGIPLYDHITAGTPLTVDRMWLTLGNASASQELDIPAHTLPAIPTVASNLEIIFGFRDYYRDVLQDVPESLMEKWQAKYLSDRWATQDYYLSPYSRHKVVTNPLLAANVANPLATNSSFYTTWTPAVVNSPIFPTNWLPIIDPDIIGYPDITYKPSAFVNNLYKHRKAFTDAFLAYYISDNAVLSDVSADTVNYTLRVKDLDILSHNFDSEIVRIYNGTVWIDFTSIKRSLVGTDTEIVLRKPTPAITTPVMFNPSSAKMRYRRVVTVPSNQIQLNSSSFTITWPDSVITNNVAISSIALAKLVSSASGTTQYSTSGSGSSSLTVTFVNDKNVTVTLGSNITGAPFTSGTISFMYEAEVDLSTFKHPDPSKICTALFSNTPAGATYNLLAAFSSTTAPVATPPWANVTNWQGITGSNDYERLKNLYQLISAGLASTAQLDIITTNLKINKDQFIRMMVLMEICEKHITNTFTSRKPTSEELYELASIFVVSIRKYLNPFWVKEEVVHITSSGGQAEALMLWSKFFWKPEEEPLEGSWDPSLQTIPASTGSITAKHIPILDPELLPEKELLYRPDAEVYRVIYNIRKNALLTEKNSYFGYLIPHDPKGLIKILNRINTNSIGSSPYNPSYTISPYTGTTALDDLATDFRSNDVFKQKTATTAAFTAFSLGVEDLTYILSFRDAYENTDPFKHPNKSEIEKAVKILVSAYKRKTLYNTGNWIADEITGIASFTYNSTSYTLPSVKYYNVRKMRLPVGRSDRANRKEWQKTLKEWNRLPFIHPDIVPPENIKFFTYSNSVVSDAWINRKINLNDIIYAGIATYLNTGLSVATLFTNFKNQISLVIAREVNFNPSALSGLSYVTYFTDIALAEQSGLDIRPTLEQLGIRVSEYRVLARVYKVLSNSGAITASEWKDVIDILVHIRMNYLSLAHVLEEYSLGVGTITLSSGAFKNYRPPLSNFPKNELPYLNPWRAPHDERKQWLDTLETRIDREKAVKEKWKGVLEETEDRTMPFLRDALIKVQRLDCESLEETAERLARTLLIETKDNCCVKHTRVSHAIETIQGLYFALNTGLFDDYVSGFSLTAPNFKTEWAWLGSYATWRSATFIYIYPENLLYPTLKRSQSPAFIELAEKLQNANRLSPEQACAAAKSYQRYFEDIMDLEIICSTTGSASVLKENANACCDTVTQINYKSFFFAQSRLTGTVYWSVKDNLDASENALGYWQPLDLGGRKDATVLGCYYLSEGYNWTNYRATNPKLWLFYSYKEKGKLQLAYIKKDLSVAGSSWTEESTTEELPKHQVDNGGTEKRFPIKVTACQHDFCANGPVFILTYEEKQEFNQVPACYDKETNKLDIIVTGGTKEVLRSINKNVKGGIRHNLSSSSGGGNQGFATLILENYLYVIPISAWEAGIGIFMVPSFQTYTIQSAFLSREKANTIIVFLKNASGQKAVAKLELDFTRDSGSGKVTPSGIWTNDSSITKGAPIGSIEKVSPIFSEKLSNVEIFAVKMDSGSPLAGCMNTPANTHFIGLDKLFRLAPERASIPIESAECINNISVRKSNVQTHMVTNETKPFTDFGHSIVVREYLREAYYFVPMLLGLDQQHRGQYPAALAWYRSVYDYTNTDVTGRKIFYGLVTEESVANITEHCANWLLDPLNPHLIAQTRTNAYTKYTMMNIIQCIVAYADREFTLDTIESVPNARKLYSSAIDLLNTQDLQLVTDPCAEPISCLEKEIDLPAEGYYNSLFKLLQNEISALGSSNLITTAENKIAQILKGTFNESFGGSIINTAPMSLDQRFAFAFKWLSAQAPVAGLTGTVNGLLVGLGTRLNNIYQYVSAPGGNSVFNLNVGNWYNQNVANIMGVAPGGLATLAGNGSLDWMTSDMPANGTPLDFILLGPDGLPYLNGAYEYNPLVHDHISYNLNLQRSNPNNFVAFQSSETVVDVYTPLIDYSFCLPKNPVYQMLLLKANLELYKIFNCRNIAGMVRELDVYAAPTDSSTGMPVIGASGNLVLPGKSNYAPSQYRFKVLLERAKQITTQAQQMESLFLAALEKEDAESYSQLRAKQDIQTARGQVKLQDLRITQANNERTVADIQLAKANAIYANFDSWISAGLNAFEKASLKNLEISKDIYIASAIANGIASGAATYAAFNDAKTGKTEKVSLVAGLISQTARDTASTYSALASIAAQNASYQRREQEWMYQRVVAGFDISLANQQIKIADDNIRIVSQEKEIAQLGLEHAERNYDFIRSKFTNAALYKWMGNVMERCYSYMLNLATSIARSAERQLYFERQEQAGPFILDDYWETPSSGFTGGSSNGVTDRRGLTGSHRLLVDITKLEQHAFDTNKRKLQMTKVISLAGNFPAEFQHFRETGVLNFELTNRLFDYDFPGHYLRLIQGVKTSVIGLVPVYDSIKATLTASTTSYTVTGGTIFQKTPIRRLEVDSVALTNTTNATGVFEMQPQQGELLNPFEGMGIESRWEFKMPQFSNRMDFTNIADVLLTVDYTALDSYQYRFQVLQDLDNKLGFNRGFSLKNDFPDQWYELGEAQASANPISVVLNMRREYFPQGVSDLKLNGTDITVYFVREDGFEEEIVGAAVMLASQTITPDQSTTEGKLSTGGLMNALSGNPIQDIKLSIANNSINRDLFSNGKVRDILIIMPCKAELKAYPL